MTDRELMQMALDALEKSRVFVTTKEKIKHPEGTDWYDEQIKALRDRLAQPEPEPVAFVSGYYAGNCVVLPIDKSKVLNPGTPLYTAPPKREWVGLTKAEFEEAVDGLEDLEDCWMMIEAKLKEKNT